MNPWDSRFNTSDYVFGTKPAAALEKLAHYLVPNGKTLVVADGEGRNSVYLARLGFEVVATDYSVVGIRKAQSLAQEHDVNITYKVQDIYTTNWSETQYDNVVAIFIQFVPPPKIVPIFTGLRIATKSGGTLLLHGYTPEQVSLGTGGPANPDQMYTKSLLESIFSDMTILVNNEYHKVLREGKGHHGQSALIDFVAKAL